MGLTLGHMPIKDGLLISGLLLHFDDESYWNDQSKELGLTYSIEPGFFESDNAFDAIEKWAGKEISFYPPEHLMEQFGHYNDAANLKYRPKNWAKDHTDKEPRNLGAIGCRELAVNQGLEDTVQVQDLSSQYICTQIPVAEGDKLWDVCSGSGGKSLNLASGGEGQFYLSDMRPATIENAKSRFRAMHYEASFGIADLTKEVNSVKFSGEIIGDSYFDTIVADVPCSGSGTWFRTPEHFTRFDYASLAKYAEKQKAIVKNAISFLKKEGKFYYITCSIFKEENEEVRDWILANTDLKMEEEIAFDGIRQKADGMYMVSFTK
jgi:16S rRNA C967 or C1407 C5-methylase (RsmB/RsmF family)